MKAWENLGLKVKIYSTDPDTEIKMCYNYLRKILKIIIIKML